MDGNREPSLKAWAIFIRPLTRTSTPSLAVGLLPKEPLIVNSKL